MTCFKLVCNHKTIAESKTMRMANMQYEIALAALRAMDVKPEEHMLTIAIERS